MAAFTLWWQMHAWRTPEVLASTRFSRPDGDEHVSFSLLLPARHEQAVLDHTVQRLLESTHADFEIIVIVGHDDPGTTAVAERAAGRDPRVRVVVDTHEKKNKPKATNTALPHCRGDVVGVFDAEDQVHPELLAHVDHAFRTTGADVVQGGVQLINFHSSWYSLRNCLEYFFWFRSRLHLHARRGSYRSAATPSSSAPTSSGRRTAGTPTVSRRTATWASGCPASARRSSSRTTPTWSPVRRPRAR